MYPKGCAKAFEVLMQRVISIFITFTSNLRSVFSTLSRASIPTYSIYRLISGEFSMIRSSSLENSSSATRISAVAKRPPS